MKTNEELNKTPSNSEIVILAAALALSSSNLTNLATTPERARVHWESYLRRILDQLPPKEPPLDENILLEMIQKSWTLAESLREG